MRSSDKLSSQFSPNDDVIDDPSRLGQAKSEIGSRNDKSQVNSFDRTVMNVKPKYLIGDQALNDAVAEEYKQNAAEERERFKNGLAGSSWLGKVISNTFDYSGKSDLDF